jgi:hypothetical protein
VRMHMIVRVGMLMRTARRMAVRLISVVRHAALPGQVHKVARLTPRIKLLLPLTAHV